MGFWLSDGTVSLVSNSKTVTGTGTAFKSGANPARVGQSLIIYVGGNSAIYEIERVDSDSSMQIAMPWRGATVNNTPYAINTASEGSPSDLARRAAQVMGYYQGQLDVIQQLLSGSGIVTATLPDGTVLNIPAYSSLPTKDDLSKKQDTLSITDFGKSLIDDDGASSARKTLGLGLSSTKDFGELDGQLMQVGAFGLGSVVRQKYVSLSQLAHTGFHHTDANTLGLVGGTISYHAIYSMITESAAMRLMCQYNAHNIQFQLYNSGWGASYSFLHTGNSVKDANGFWKGASPVMRLHGNPDDDSIAYLYRDEGWSKSGCSVVNGEAVGAEATRLGVGHYRVTGCHGFARDGWYIETPNDANGNKLLFVRYQQHDDGGIEIWTSSPDYSSGRCAEGEPVDIPAGRWIDLRLCMDDRDISLAS